MTCLCSKKKKTHPITNKKSRSYNAIPVVWCIMYQAFVTVAADRPLHSDQVSSSHYVMLSVGHIAYRPPACPDSKPADWQSIDCNTHMSTHTQSQNKVHTALLKHVWPCKVDFPFEKQISLFHRNTVSAFDFLLKYTNNVTFCVYFPMHHCPLLVSITTCCHTSTYDVDQWNHQDKIPSTNLIQSYRVVMLHMQHYWYISTLWCQLILATDGNKCLLVLPVLSLTMKFTCFFNSFPQGIFFSNWLGCFAHICHRTHFYQSSETCQGKMCVDSLIQNHILLNLIFHIRNCIISLSLQKLRLNIAMLYSEKWTGTCVVCIYSTRYHL